MRLQRPLGCTQIDTGTVHTHTHTHTITISLSQPAPHPATHPGWPRPRLQERQPRQHLLPAPGGRGATPGLCGHGGGARGAAAAAGQQRRAVAAPAGRFAAAGGAAGACVPRRLPRARPPGEEQGAAGGRQGWRLLHKFVPVLEAVCFVLLLLLAAPAAAGCVSRRASLPACPGWGAAHPHPRPALHCAVPALSPCPAPVPCSCACRLQNGRVTPTLSYWCFSPGLSMQQLTDMKVWAAGGGPAGSASATPPHMLHHA